MELSLLNKIFKNLFKPVISLKDCGYHYIKLSPSDAQEIWVASSSKDEIVKGDFSHIASLAALPLGLIDEEILYKDGPPSEETLHYVAVRLHNIIAEINPGQVIKYHDKNGLLDKGKLE